MAIKLEDVAHPQALLVGAGLYLLWNYGLPAVVGALRPVVKTGIKGGIVAGQ